MHELTVFVSSDGQAFPSAELCILWEKLYKKLQIINDNNKHFPLYRPDQFKSDVDAEWELDFPEEVYDFFRSCHEQGVRDLFSLDISQRKGIDRALCWKAARLIEFLRGWKAVSDWIWDGIDEE